MANAFPPRTLSLVVDPVTPADIVVPVACDQVTIIGLNDASLFYRGGAGQPEIEILAGTDRTIGGPIGYPGRTFYGVTRLTRFAENDVAGQLRSSAGAGPVSLVCQ